MTKAKVADLSGWGYWELGQLATALQELADKGNVEGTEFSLDSLKAVFDPNEPEVYLEDADGNSYPDKKED